MGDIVDAATRSRMMSGIRSRNTRPELLVRKGLHARGFRFRLHDRALPGNPDLVLPRWKALVLVHGCFWHRHEGCRFATTPATREEFWTEKFELNVRRDRRNADLLRGLGWRLATVWECSIRAQEEKLMDDLAAWLRTGSPEFESLPAAPPA
jgi:DNA mismatch endonuclease, patch repair protein